LLSHVEGDISCTPIRHGTRPLLMVHQRQFNLMAIILPRLLNFFNPVLQELEYGFMAQRGHTTGLTVSQLMASLYSEMRNVKNRHSNNYSVVELTSRAAFILSCSPTPAQDLSLILT
jgi:hypothetical protein